MKEQLHEKCLAPLSLLEVMRQGRQFLRGIHFLHQLYILTGFVCSVYLPNE